MHKGRNLIGNRRIMELSLAGHVLEKMTDEEVQSYHPSLPFWQRIFYAANMVKVSLSINVCAISRAGNRGWYSLLRLLEGNSTF